MRHVVRPRLSFVVLLFVLGFAAQVASGASKPRQLTVMADGHPLALWAREVPQPRGAVVLLHGRTWSSLPDFDLDVKGESRSVMQSLNARGYSAYALDLRGYGQSPRDSSGWLTPDRAARDVIAALEWLAKERKVTRPTLLGWSNGSIVAQLSAQRRPDLLANLILYGYPRDPDDPVSRQPVPAEPAREPNTRERAVSDFIAPGMIPGEVVEAFVSAALAADPVRVDWRAPEELAELDPSKIVTPTLVLQGARDPLAPDDAQARLYTRLGTSDRQWVTLPGAGHAALIEDAHAAFITAIVGFIERPALPARSFRDLNRNGRLDPYEDPRLSDEVRTHDLVSRMTLEEKVGALMHDTLPGRSEREGGPVVGYDFEAVERAILSRHVNSFITRLELTPAELAERNNRLQQIAARSRLGIPVTVSTDPRHHFQAVLGASSSASGFSQWPEPLGFAAIGDPELVRRFGDIARQEYRAVGIHMALSPQADLATEPRWPRINGTFGSRPERVSELVAAYVEGFQGGRRGVTRDGVATVVKHWVGYGAQPEGFDGHNFYGRTASFTNDAFGLHVAAFRGAFDVKVAGVMPAYPVLHGVTLEGRLLEPVAPGFSAQLLQNLLRRQHEFDGFILSDWAITRDCNEACRAPTAERPQGRADIATPWGVEHLSVSERFAKGLNAGLDQFGGTSDVENLLQAVRSGLVPLQRIDDAVRRVMWLKFRLGLFDDAMVEPARATAIVGSAQFRSEGEAAQRRALVVLENDGGVLPAGAGRKVWLSGLDAGAARAAGLTVVASPKEADFAIVRAGAPFETLHPHHFFGSFQHEGRLDFREGDATYQAIRAASAEVPTIAVIDLDRPAILTNLRGRVKGLIAAFGASDAAVLDVILGKARAEGRLPFDLPSSMEDVVRQRPDLPDDTKQPLYEVGQGLDLRVH